METRVVAQLKGHAVLSKQVCVYHHPQDVDTFDGVANKRTNAMEKNTEKMLALPI